MDEQINAYLVYLAQCESLCDRLDELLNEDSEEIHSAIHGEPERLYREACEAAKEELSKMKKQMKILYSEACAGLI